MSKKISWILFKALVLLCCSPSQAQPGAPSAVYPEPSAILAANSTVSFYWSFGYPQAQSFELLVSADAGFGQIQHAAAGLLSNKYEWSAGAPSGLYYWKVRGLLQGIPGDWSPVRSFILFSPLNLPGLQLWLRADTGTVLQGNRITQWNDLSPNQFSFVQPDTARQFRINQGYSGLTFGEAFGSQIYELPMFPWNNANTGFVVGRRTGGLPYGCFYSAPNYSFDCHTNICVITNTLQGTTTVGFWNIDSLAVLTLRRIPGNSAAYKNSQLSSPTATNPIDTLGPGPLRIGNRFDNITQLTGMFGEMIICNTAVNDSLRSLTEAYLMNRFDGEINLPSDTVLTGSFCPFTVPLPSGVRNAIWHDGSTAAQFIVTQPQSISFTGTDRFGRAISDTMNIRFPDLIYPTQTSLCKDSSISWTPMAQGSVSLLWSDGSTANTLQISQPGSYFAQITDGSGCSFLTDTILISLDYLSHEANLGNDTSLCRGNPLKLTPVSVPGAQFNWNTGETTETITLDSTATYWVHAVSPAGCPASDTINILIQGEAPLVDFSTGQGCIGDTIFFNDLSIAPAGSTLSSWNWNLGNGNFSGQTNAFGVYPDTGLYNISLRVAEQNGCSNLMQKTIRIYKKPHAAASFLNACENAAVPFIDLSDSFNGNISQWLWDFGDQASGAQNQSALQNPQHRFTQTGNFSVQLLIINNAGCSDTISIPVNVKPKPLAQVSYQENCPGLAFQVYSTSIAPFPHSIIQNFWNDSLNGGTFPFPASGPGSYPIKLISLASNGCRDTLVKHIPVPPLPRPKILFSPPCTQTPFSLSDQGTCDSCTHRFYQWKWNGATVSQQAYIDTIIPQILNAQVILGLTDQRGCQGFDTTVITFENPPVANILIPGEIYGAPVSLSFSHNGDPDLIALWQCMGESQIGDKVVFTFNEAGEQNLRLILATPQGCSDTASAIIDIPAARADLSLSLTGFSPASDGYLRPVLQVKNRGNVPEKNFRIVVEPGFSAPYEEEFGGLLNPGDSARITTAESFLPRTMLANLCCASILKDGLPAEEIISNNKSCQPIDGQIEGMDEAFPNPAGSEVYLRIYSLSEKKSTLMLHDAAGKMVKQWEIARTPGYQTIRLETSEFAAGAYQLTLFPEAQNRRLLIKGVKGP